MQYLRRLTSLVFFAPLYCTDTCGVNGIYFIAPIHESLCSVYVRRRKAVNFWRCAEIHNVFHARFGYRRELQHEVNDKIDGSVVAVVAWLLLATSHIVESTLSRSPRYWLPTPR